MWFKPNKNLQALSKCSHNKCDDKWKKKVDRMVELMDNSMSFQERLNLMEMSYQQKKALRDGNMKKAEEYYEKRMCMIEEAREKRLNEEEKDSIMLEFEECRLLNCRDFLKKYMMSDLLDLRKEMDKFFKNDEKNGKNGKMEEYVNEMDSIMEDMKGDEKSLTPVRVKRFLRLLQESQYMLFREKRRNGKDKDSEKNYMLNPKFVELKDYPKMIKEKMNGIDVKDVKDVVDNFDNVLFTIRGYLTLKQCIEKHDDCRILYYKTEIKDERNEKDGKIELMDRLFNLRHDARKVKNNENDIRDVVDKLVNISKSYLVCVFEKGDCVSDVGKAVGFLVDVIDNFIKSYSSLLDNVSGNEMEKFSNFRDLFVELKKKWTEAKTSSEYFKIYKEILINFEFLNNLKSFYYFHHVIKTTKGEKGRKGKKRGMNFKNKKFHQKKDN